MILTSGHIIGFDGEIGMLTFEIHCLSAYQDLGITVAEIKQRV